MKVIAVDYDNTYAMTDAERAKWWEERAKFWKQSSQKWETDCLILRGAVENTIKMSANTFTQNYLKGHLRIVSPASVYYLDTVGAFRR